MSKDLISDVLRSVRLEGTMYFEARMTGSWGFHITESQNSSFHYLTQGSAWISMPDGSWSELRPGDTVVLPHGEAHTLSDRPDPSFGIEGTALFEKMDDSGIVRLCDGSAAPETRIICGHFSTDRTMNHPLLSSLPPVVRSVGNKSTAWSNLAELTVARSKDLSPGSRALTDRLAEVLLIEVITSLDKQDSGFLSCLEDPMLTATLQAIHDYPERDWNLDSLARHVSVSRSTLSHRFVSQMSESPIRYLTRWRMHIAASYLRDTALSVEQIAQRVGYQTPFSLSKAFTREFGLAPSAYRDSPVTPLSEVGI